MQVNKSWQIYKKIRQEEAREREGEKESHIIAGMLIWQQKTAYSEWLRSFPKENSKLSGVLETF